MARTIDGQLIGRNVSGIISVPFHPLEARLHALAISLVNLMQDLFNQIAILNRPTGRSSPIVPPPIRAPDRDTIDRVGAISVDAYLAVTWCNFERSIHRREFRPLIGLTRPSESF